jgi:hypothetical protein
MRFTTFALAIPPNASYMLIIKVLQCMVEEGFDMEKPHAKLGKSSKGTDDAQFERFLEAARKRGVNESLEDFAVKYGAIAPLQQPTKRAE